MSLKKGEELLEDDGEEEGAELELIMANNVKGILDIPVYKLYIISKKIKIIYYIKIKIIYYIKIKIIYYIKIKIIYRKLFRLYTDLKKLYDLSLLNNNLYTAIILDD